MQPSSPAAYKLLHEGSIALAQVERNGIRVDTEYLQREKIDLQKRREKLERKMRADDVFHQWKKRYGHQTKWGSDTQLADVLFNVMGHPCNAWTGPGAIRAENLRRDGLTDKEVQKIMKREGHRPSTDQTVLEAVDIPFTANYIQYKKFGKALNTYLTSIEREIVDGRVHPNFNLHLVNTFRGSCDNPNFQNMPIRDPLIAEIIRQCFIPSRGHCLIETDYSGIEVKIAACYHKDPTMIKYIKDPTTDMHRDMAAQIYKLKENDVEKAVRHAAKNLYVFPQFYGDYYINCARNMWEAINRYKLENGKGESLHDHLAARGITRLGVLDPQDKQPPKGTFVRHMKEVERDFWGKRFPIYDKWRTDWYAAYKSRGWFDMKTGFVVHGLHDRNQVINAPVQGSAFHCLLWSLTRMNRIMMKRKMRSRIVGQIHDSIVADVHKREVDDYLNLAQQVMVADLMKHFEWIIVPIEFGAEVTPIDTSWHSKEEWKADRKGHWSKAGKV